MDTAGEVRINRAVVGHVANMHVRHMLEIRSHLRAKRLNTLEIEIVSALVYAGAQEEKYPYSVPRNVHVGSLPHRQFIRKTQVGGCIPVVSMCFGSGRVEENDWRSTGTPY